MDLATVIGIFSGILVVGAAIALGGQAIEFLDLASFLMVIGGTSAGTLIRFPLHGVMSALILGAKIAFIHNKTTPADIIDETIQLADVMRRQGPLAMEQMQVDNEMLEKGAGLIADGHDLYTIRDALERERDLFLDRLEEGLFIFKAIGDAAPAFGMIGTIVGLVQMLAALEDPSTIGPSMALALLTTLYGALIANMVALPLSDKLARKAKIERVNSNVAIDGIMQVAEAKSPTLIREMLKSYLPADHPSLKEMAPAQQGGTQQPA